MRKEISVRTRSSGWERILISVFSRSQRIKKSQQKISSRQLSSILIKGLSLLVLASLWYWNWQILISAGTGLGLMRIVYGGTSPRLQKSWRTLSNVLVGYNRKLAFTLSSGILGGLFTYLATTVWVETGNPWLAFSSILQGLVSLTTLTLLGWYIKKETSHRQHNRFGDLLAELSSQDDLKCLIAINQLTEMVKEGKLHHERRTQLITYFQFMLGQSQDSTIQDSLLDGLDVLELNNLSLAVRNSSQNIVLKQPLAKRLSLELER